MEFHEKVQELRKSRGLTQEELASELFVSRAAISKWESGKGYPSIDSLKAISTFFNASPDDLLSSEQALGVAETDYKAKAQQFRAIVFGLLALALQNSENRTWVSFGTKASLSLSSLMALLFIASREPNAAALTFIFLAIKASVLMKRV